MPKPIGDIENGLLTTPTFIRGRPEPRASLPERMQHYHVPGASVAISNDGAIDWSKGYGVANALDGTPVTTDTRFYAASISKPLAAAAALVLVEADVLDLDEDINERLSSWKVPENEFTVDEKVTLRRLLSHSAGLDAGEYAGYAADQGIPSLRQLLNGEPPSNSGPVRVVFVPGSRSVYSGAGYWVLQQLLEDVTRQSLAQLVQHAVFDRLGMHHSTFRRPLPPVHAHSAATGHDEEGKPTDEAWGRHPGVADGGLWTTLSDLARFLSELLLSYRGCSSRVLSPPMTRQMLTVQSGHHGLGIHVFSDGQTVRVSHGGEGVGFQCLMAAFPQTGQGAVAMSNGANGYALILELLRSLAEAYGWPDYGAAGRRVVDLGPDLLDVYEGEYQLGEDVEEYGDYAGQWQVRHMPMAVFSVRREQDGLLIRDPVGDRLHYHAETTTSFFAVEREGVVNFARDRSGRVSKLQVIHKYATFRARRIAASGPARGAWRV